MGELLLTNVRPAKQLTSLNTSNSHNIADLQTVPVHGTETYGRAERQQRGGGNGDQEGPGQVPGGLTHRQAGYIQ